MKTAGGLIYNDIWEEENTNKTAVLLEVGGGGRKTEGESEKKKRFEGNDHK